MLVYLVHEKHGTHIAYSPLEVEKCLVNGWKLRDEVREAPVAPLSQFETLPVPKKRGRSKKVAV